MVAPWPGRGPRQSPFAAAGLTWRVFQAFADAEFVGAHPRLAAYLSGADALMHFELAGRSAALLEQYTTYRADGLLAWSAGQAWPEHDDAPGDVLADAAWQAALWRRISAEIEQAKRRDRGPPARRPLLRSLPQRAAAGPMAAALARPAHIFGLPTVAPLHLQWLQQLARHAEIHLYVLNPCQEHWFDLVDPRRLAQLQARGLAQGFEVGNRLLSTWGRQTQVHLDALVTGTGADTTDTTLYLPARGGQLLAQLQNSILELREPAPAGFTLSDGDRSVEVHVCHSLTRQLEVLHSHLLGLFADAESNGQALAPGRVLVAVPDLDAAAPLIDAVFGTAPRERQLPYLITGRARSADDAPAQALLGLLALAGSRWAASEVFAVLQQPLVARRFGLVSGQDDAALQQVRGWLAEASIRWGEDGEHRAALGLPASHTHTWADGLARLFLGYALPAEGQAGDATTHTLTTEPWAGLLPAGLAEGLQAQALGGLWAFVQALGELRRQSRQPLPPAAWGPLLQQQLPRFLHAGPGEGIDASGNVDALLALQAAIAELSTRWQTSALTTPLPLAVVRAALAQQLDASAPGRRARRRRHLRLDGVLARPALRRGVCARPGRRRLAQRGTAAGIRPDGRAPAPWRPPAPQRGPQRLPRPAAGRAPQPVPGLHRAQPARQHGAHAVGAGDRTAGRADHGRRAHACGCHRRHQPGPRTRPAGGGTPAAAVRAGRVRHPARCRHAPAQPRRRPGAGAAGQPARDGAAGRARYRHPSSRRCARCPGRSR